MASSPAIALQMLPVQSRPGYAASIALDRLSAVAKRVEKVLAPSFYKRLLKGSSGNKDHARAVVAACAEEVKAIRMVLQEAMLHANHSRTNPAAAGSLERVIKLVDEWKDISLEFEEAAFGADQLLLATTRRLMTLCSDLKNPAAGLY